MRSVVIFLAVSALGTGTKLPSYFTRCSRSDPELSECIVRSAREGWPMMLKGDKSILFLTADPLYVPILFIDVDGNLKINMTDSKIIGLRDAKFKELKFDFKRKTIDISVYFDNISLVGTYDIKGHILVLPINGAGPANITYAAATFKLHLNYELKEQPNKKQHIVIVKKLLRYDLKRAYFKLDNLFNGSKQLAKYFTKCSKTDPNLNECILKNARDVWPTLSQTGDKTVHVPSASPFLLSQLYIDVDGNLKINMTDCALYGLDKTQFKDINLNLEKKTLDLTFTADKVYLLGHYDIKGKILVLPLIGNGAANITFVGGTYTYHSDYKLVEKKKKHHIVIEKQKLTYVLTRAYFKLDGLFSRDKALAEETHKILDESWEAVNNEIGAKVGDAMGEILASLMTSFFGQVAYEDMFLD